MKLSSRLYRQIEIKIRRSIAAETPRTETTPLPDPNTRSIKPATQEASGSR